MRLSFPAFFIGGVFIVLASLGLLFLLVIPDVLADKKSTSPDRPAIFIVAAGENADQVRKKLVNMGLLKHDWSFRFLTELLNAGASFKAGQYSLRSSMSAREILHVLVGGKAISDSVRLTIREGMTIQDIDRLLAKKGLIKAGLLQNQEATLLDEFRARRTYPWLAKEAKTLEGYLFPDTYLFKKSDDENQFLRMAVGKMLENFDAKVIMGLLGGRIEPRYEVMPGFERSFYDILIMASILEREVVTEHEKKLAAGVLWKRINSGRLLQVDATVNYATGKNLPGVTLDDTQIDSEYNTYRRLGLPPTPISNPGTESIQAALTPQASQYWFYLTPPDGRTLFSQTFEEHLIKKRRYLDQ